MELNDVFGQAFRDYMKGETNHNILVHTDIAEDDLLPVKYFFRQFEDLPLLEQKALQLCTGKILDVGSGAGCHSAILQNMGADIHSMDISEGAIDIQIERGLKNAFCADFFEMNTQTRYDTLLILMDSIGLVGKLENLPKFFSKAEQLLKPDGQIILDSANLIHLFVDEDGSAMIDLAGNYYGELEYQLEYKGQLGVPFKWIFIDFDNLQHYAELAGFKCEMLFEDDRLNYLAKITRK